MYKRQVSTCTQTRWVRRRHEPPVATIDVLEESAERVVTPSRKLHEKKWKNNRKWSKLDKWRRDKKWQGSAPADVPPKYKNNRYDMLT